MCSVNGTVTIICDYQWMITCKRYRALSITTVRSLAHTQTRPIGQSHHPVKGQFKHFAQNSMSAAAAAARREEEEDESENANS